MIPGLCAAGQMKLVGASENSGAVVAGYSPGWSSGGAPSNLSIPALTGSQIAIVYLETRAFSSQPTSYPYMFNVIATGTGVNLVVTAAIVAASDGKVNINSGFCTTSTGSQTISFTTSSLSGNIIVSQINNQACVFIYTPPF